MRKKLTTLISFVVALGIFAIVPTVNAQKLIEASDITTNVKRVLGTDANAVATYNEIDDVWDLEVTITANDDAIRTMLSQVPGNGSILSSAYHSLRPNVGWTNFYKVNGCFYNYTDKTVEQQKQYVRDTKKSSDLSSDPSVWPYAAVFEYKDGSTWKESKKSVGVHWEDYGYTYAAPGSSLGEELMSNFPGKSDISDLTYNTDYRVYMYSDRNWLYLWQNKDDASQELWIRVNYKIKYPVTGFLYGNISKGVFFTNIEDAIESNSYDIEVNNDLQIGEDIELPQYVTVTINSGATITLTNGAKFTGLGNVENEGTIIQDGDEVYSISTYMGIKANLKTATPGTRITLSNATVPTEPGYNVRLRVYDRTNGEEIEVTDNEFIMPEGNVEVLFNYKAIPVKFTKGMNGVFTGKGNLEFKTDGEYDLFGDLYIDDEEVDPKYYTVKSGSTIITLKEEFLKTLKNGEHVIKAYYYSGVDAETKFKVDVKPEEPKKEEPKEEEIENPQTGDNILTILLVEAIAVLGAVGLTVYIKKELN